MCWSTCCGPPGAGWREGGSGGGAAAPWPRRRWSGTSARAGRAGARRPLRYLFRRLFKSVYAVVDNVAEELRSSQFQPISFELGFGAGKDLPPVELSVDGMTVSISGFWTGWTAEMMGGSICGSWTTRRGAKPLI
ncbi:MAG: hypothetical protein ACLRIS_14580 [Flavonifractor plautii]